jgi:hypothetical protein
LLGNPNYPMHPPRKHDDQTTPKRAFGRAVRKLTPRKSSFVNLLKGKGWSKGDEEKPQDMPEQSIETSPHISQLNERWCEYERDVRLQRDDGYESAEWLEMATNDGNEG